MRQRCPHPKGISQCIYHRNIGQENVFTIGSFNKRCHCTVVEYSIVYFSSVLAKKKERLLR